MKKQTKRKRQNNKTYKRNNKTYKRNNKTYKRNNKTKKNHRQRKRYKRNITEFIPGNQGQGVSLFSIPEKQKPFKIILDNNHNKQFGNIILGLREM
jgi:hypothetical protein